MEKTSITHQTDSKDPGNCATNQSFNFTVGAVALVVAGIIGYVVYKYWLKG